MKTETLSLNQACNTAGAFLDLVTNLELATSLNYRVELARVQKLCHTKNPDVAVVQEIEGFLSDTYLLALQNKLATNFPRSKRQAFFTAVGLAGSTCHEAVAAELGAVDEPILDDGEPEILTYEVHLDDDAAHTLRFAISEVVDGDWVATQEPLDCGHYLAFIRVAEDLADDLEDILDDHPAVVQWDLQD